MYALQEYLHWWKGKGYDASVRIIQIDALDHIAFVEVHDRRRDVSWRNHETELHLNIQDALTELAKSIQERE